MTSGRPDVASTGSEDNVGPSAWATEQTPLIAPSGATDANGLENGHGDGNGNGFGASNETNGRPGSSAADADPDGTAKVPVGRLRAVAIAVSTWLLIFLQTSNMSGMTMIQGSVAADLDAYDLTTWFTTSYLFATSAAPLFGKLATIFPPKALVLPSALFLALGSLVVAFSRSFAVFIVGRLLMGTGCAGVMTLTIILILDLTDRRRRGFFIGLVNASFTFGVSFGAVVYGALLPAIGWRPMFWMQSPIALAGGIGLFLSIPTPPQPHGAPLKSGTIWQKLRSIDYLGAALLLLTIFLFLYGLAGEIQPVTLLLSAASLTIFVAVEFFFATDPIIPVRVLSSRGVLLSCLAQVGTMSARWTVLFYSPIFVLAALGASPASSGSVLIPTNFGFGAGGLIVGALHIRRSGSFWMPSILSLVGFAVSLFVLSLVVVPDPSVPIFIALILINGLFTGATLAYTLAHVLHHSHDGTHYVTTSLLTTFRGFGGSFGTTLGGGVFSRDLRARLSEGFLSLDGGLELTPERRRLISKLLSGPELVWHGGLSVEERSIAVDGYAGALRSVWQAGAIVGLIVIVAQAATGWTGPEKPSKLAEDPRRRLVESEDDDTE